MILCKVSWIKFLQEIKNKMKTGIFKKYAHWSTLIMEKEY